MTDIVNLINGEILFRKGLLLESMHYFTFCVLQISTLFQNDHFRDWFTCI